MSAGIGDYAQVLLNGNWDSSGDLSEGYTQLCGGWWTFEQVPAQNCIRNMLMFDDMLVMLSNPDLNSGIMGYRSGQKIENSDDFITLL